MSTRSLGKNVVDGVQLSLGYAGVNALRALGGRLGLDNLIAPIPGVGRTVAEYALKIINIGIAGALAGMVSGRFATNAKYGGMTNFGVSLITDLSGMFGESGGVFRSYLPGVGDYNLAYGMGTAMNPRMGNYNLVGGGQAMLPVSADEVYGDVADVY